MAYPHDDCPGKEFNLNMNWPNLGPNEPKWIHQDCHNPPGSRQMLYHHRTKQPWRVGQEVDHGGYHGKGTVIAVYKDDVTSEGTLYLVRSIRPI